MGRPGLTRDQVIAAAIRLLARGENPSVRNVRRELGETGSNATIAGHLSAWRQTLNERNLEVLPPALPPVLEEPLRALWAAAVEAASAAYAEHKQALDARTAQAREAQRAAEARAQAADTETARLNAVLIERGAALAQCQTERDRALDHGAALEDQLQAVRTEAAQSLAKAQADARQARERLEARLAALTQQLQRETERSDAQQRHWIAQLDTARQEAAQLREASAREASAHQAALTLARERQGALERRLASQEAQAEHQSTQIMTLRQALDQVQARAERLAQLAERRRGALDQVGHLWRQAAQVALEVATDTKLTPAQRSARLRRVLALPGGLGGDE